MRISVFPFIQLRELIDYTFRFKGIDGQLPWAATHESISKEEEWGGILRDPLWEILVKRFLESRHRSFSFFKSKYLPKHAHTRIPLSCCIWTSAQRKFIKGVSHRVWENDYNRRRKRKNYYMKRPQIKPFSCFYILIKTLRECVWHKDHLNIFRLEADLYRKHSYTLTKAVVIGNTF